MHSFSESYALDTSSNGRFRAIKACDISGMDDKLLGVVARTSLPINGHGDPEWEFHNTLITFYCKGSIARLQSALGEGVQDPERVSTLPGIIRHNGQPVHRITMHCDFIISGLEHSTRSKIKSMVDSLSEKGLIRQTTTEALYRQLSLLPSPHESNSPHTRPTHARY
jgi:hypothetical protein